MRELGFVAVMAMLLGAVGMSANQTALVPGKQIHGPGITERPVMNLPLSLRQANWRGKNGSGSCVHASWMSCLRWQGKPEMADYWGSKYDGGENYDEMVQRLDAEGIRWAGTCGQGDVKFLEWMHRTRRGCIVTWSPRHVVCLVHFDSKWAGILNNNDIENIKWIPREEFLTEWKARGSWAMTPVYTPAAPLGN